MALKAKAYAKINLFLDITGKRPDGYHNLDTVMQSISVFDEITLKFTDSGITVRCDKEELAGESNIVFKACKAFFEYSGVTGGIDIEINKNIPVAAGLGGGSADAAAALVLLNIATKRNYPVERLIPIAAKLGADVPFCLMGGTARAQGIGEMLTPVAAPSMYYVLLKEQEKQSTGQMYAKLDSVDYLKTGDIEGLLDGMKRGNKDKIASNFFNAFEYCWSFENMSSAFKSYNPMNVFLSGSGPTVCAFFESKAKAENCADELKSKGYNAFFAESKSFGVEIV